MIRIGCKPPGARWAKTGFGARVCEGDQIREIIDKILAKKKKKSAEKSPECEKKINMVSGVVGKENPLQNRGLCASQIFGRFFPRLCTKPLRPKGPVMIFRRSWPNLFAKATRL